MQVNTEDITVAWGQQPPALDQQTGKWRLACFQDVQESIDASKLYFLYDPQADEQCGTTGTRKGYPGLIIFDLNMRCFAAELPLHNPGAMKFLFSLKCPSPQGGSSFVLVTEEQVYGQIRLHIFRIDLASDGISVANSRALINQALSIGGEYICSMREDAPELVVMANPGLQVWRINCMVEQPSPPSSYFTVNGADLNHFYDGFLNNGSVHFLSASPDGHLDNSRVHILNLDNQGPITTQNCSGDPQRGMPAPRKQVGIDIVPNAILFAGGEVDHGTHVDRLVDYWMLDTRTFQWTQIPASMPCPLIEPRLTVGNNSGNVYVWGDFDQPLPGMPAGGTHLRILRVSGLEKAGHPPTYNQTMAPPPVYPQVNESQPYPQQGGGGGGYPQQQYPQQNQGGYPQQNQGGYPQQNQGGYPQQQGYGQAPPYPSYNPSQSNPNMGGGQSQPYGNQMNYNPGVKGTYTETSSGQTAFYPSHKKKKSCVVQ